MPATQVLRISSDHAKYKGTKLAFLGTSLFPGTTDPCLLIKNEGKCFIFNCGDNIYRELQRESYLDKQKQCTIFIASMDLNNVVGLPGLLSPGILPPPVVIYGPQGLRQYIRSTLQACFARVPTKYAVHELITDSSLRIGNQQPDDLMHDDELYGDDLLCCGRDSHQLIKDEHLSIAAWSLGQNTQSWGFLYKETGNLQTSIALITQETERDWSRIEAKGVDVLVHDIRKNTSDAAGDRAKLMDAGSLVLVGRERNRIQELEKAKSALGKDRVAWGLDQATLTVWSNRESLSSGSRS